MDEVRFAVFHTATKRGVLLCASMGRDQKRVFQTFTHDLLALADWLRECGVTHVALESTGIYMLHPNRTVPLPVASSNGLSIVPASIAGAYAGVRFTVAM
jgi:hypothetical protein